MARMTSWAKKDPAANKEILESKGEHRRQFLQKSLAMASREKKARSYQTTERSAGSEIRSQTEKGWFSYEVLKGRLGMARLDAYINAGKIKSKEDPDLGDIAARVDMKDYWWDLTKIIDDTIDRTMTSLDTSVDDVDVKKAMKQFDDMAAEASKNNNTHTQTQQQNKHKTKQSMKGFRRSASKFFHWQCEGQCEGAANAARARR
jgi:hypothetical protein